MDTRIGISDEFRNYTWKVSEVVSSLGSITSPLTGDWLGLQLDKFPTDGALATQRVSTAPLWISCHADQCCGFQALQMERTGVTFLHWLLTWIASHATIRSSPRGGIQLPSHMQISSSKS